ncbi:hypothetical protein HYW53_01095 [Candidatus Giovannonibacteria bacterium]|nr:hypothetical protein [Candidatus Giovannonibacteria bacterium]
MFFLFWGDHFWAKKKIEELLKKAVDKNYSVYKLTGESSDPLANFLAPDLFGRKIFLIGENIMASAFYKGELQRLTDFFVESKNIAVFFEEEFEKDFLRNAEKAGAKIAKFENSSSRVVAFGKAEAERLGISPEKTHDLLSGEDDPQRVSSKLERFSLEGKYEHAKNFSEPNYFQFADAFSEKNKKQALKLLLSYEKDGFGGEEAYWKVCWKIKMLRLIGSGGKISGIHPFVMRKSEAELKNFSSGELRKISLNLVDLFSRVRRNETSFEEGLENLILAL